jgi:hypothetical protein
MAPSDHYEPNSINAVISRIEGRQKDISHNIDEILEKLAEMNDKFQALEKSVWQERGIMAAISASVMGVFEFFKH